MRSSIVTSTISRAPAPAVSSKALQVHVSTTFLLHTFPYFILSSQVPCLKPTQDMLVGITTFSKLHILCMAPCKSGPLNNGPEGGSGGMQNPHPGACWSQP